MSNAYRDGSAWPTERVRQMIIQAMQEAGRRPPVVRWYNSMADVIELATHNPPVPVTL